MSQIPFTPAYRELALTELTTSVSAGARSVHVKSSGPAYTVDLAGVPESERASLIERIEKMIEQTKLASEAQQPVAS